MQEQRCKNDVWVCPLSKKHEQEVGVSHFFTDISYECMQMLPQAKEFHQKNDCIVNLS